MRYRIYEPKPAVKIMSIGHRQWAHRLWPALIGTMAYYRIHTVRQARSEQAESGRCRRHANYQGRARVGANAKADIFNNIPDRGIAAGIEVALLGKLRNGQILAVKTQAL
jgi:hypothetical protein